MTIEGSGLVASGAEAVEIIKDGSQILFKHPSLNNGYEWVSYRPPGVVKGDFLDIYFDWTPARSFYKAARTKGLC